VTTAALDSGVASALGREVVALESVTGGDINDAYRARLSNDRSVFVKTSSQAPAGSYRAEADGLEWLAATDTLRVPSVAAVVDELDSPIRGLVLEWIEPAAPHADFADELGRQLARMHRAGAPAFGLDRDGFLAGIPVSNQPCVTWAEFCVTRRLDPMLRQAVDLGHVPRSLVMPFDRLFDRMHDLAGEPEDPARLHGDLWTGNVMVGPDGGPWAVDPAAFGGHREMDLAMLRLFGTPDERTFGTYAEEFPLSEGWADRVELCQLLPLLVHVVLFGAGYVDGLERRVRRYV